jgi:hypothetical protein
MVNESPGKLEPNPLVVVQTTADGAVLLEMTSGDCFELNRVGTEIWTRLTKGESLASVVVAIATRYGVPAATVELDAHALVGELIRRGLAVASPR